MPTAEAQEHHDKLFPGQVSTLAGTDPELIDHFDDFAFGEPQLAGHVAANRNVGNDRSRLLDVLTQLLPYIGYPRTLNALRVLDEVAPT